MRKSNLSTKKRGKAVKGSANKDGKEAIKGSKVAEEETAYE